jgi:hypothetical protein
MASCRFLGSDERAADIASKSGGHSPESPSRNSTDRGVDADSNYSKTDQNAEANNGGELRSKETSPGLFRCDLMIEIKATVRDLPQRGQRQLIIPGAARSHIVVFVSLMLRRDITDELLLS